MGLSLATYAFCYRRHPLYRQNLDCFDNLALIRPYLISDDDTIDPKEVLLSRSKRWYSHNLNSASKLSVVAGFLPLPFATEAAPCTGGIFTFCILLRPSR